MISFQLIEAERRIHVYASVILPPLAQMMAWRQVDAKPLSETMMVYCQLEP